MEWVIYILISTILMGIGFIYRKKLLLHEHALEFTSFRSMYNLLFLSILVFFIDLKISRTNLIICLGIGLISAYAILLRNEAVRHDDLSELTPLVGLINIFTLLFGYILLRELPSGQQLLGISIIVLGVYFLEKKKTNNLFSIIKNIFVEKNVFKFVFHLFLIAITVIMVRTVVQQEHPLTILFYMWFIVSVVFLVKELFTYGIRDLNDFKRDYKSIFLFSLLMFAANIFRLYGFSFADAQGVLIEAFSSGSLVIITFFGGRIFHEKNLTHKIFAALIIFAGTLLIVV